MNRSFPTLAPSILAADFGQLDDQIKACVDEGVEWIHCDIMDGHFVPNISYGADIVKVADRHDVFLDVHLMIENPEHYIEQFVQAGADLLTVHVEACTHLHRVIQQINEHGVKAGVALNPATPVQAIEPIVNDVDLILAMSVNPGFGGQQFIDATYQKMEGLKKMREENDANFLIEVDGGVGLDNTSRLAAAGTDVFVAGSAVFKAEDIKQRINDFAHKLTE